MPAIVSPQFKRKGGFVAILNAPLFVEGLNAKFRQNAVPAKIPRKRMNATSQEQMNVYQLFKSIT